MGNFLPYWADEIVSEVWADQIKPRPIINWRNGNSHTSGWTRKDGSHISITAGKQDERWVHVYVLWHELAHAQGEDSECHSVKFWKRAWVLYRRYAPMYKLPLRAIAKCEDGYRKKSRIGRLATRS